MILDDFLNPSLFTKYLLFLKMGCSFSSSSTGLTYGSTVEASLVSRQIDKELAADEAKIKAKKLKVLLLGASESGKSTLLKQIRLEYGQKTFSDLEIQTYKSIILQNIVMITLQVMRAMRSFNVKGQKFSINVCYRKSR